MPLPAQVGPSELCLAALGRRAERVGVGGPEPDQAPGLRSQPAGSVTPGQSPGIVNAFSLKKS